MKLPDIDIPGITLKSVLGEGGMGVVCEATQTFTDRSVAVKVLHHAVSDNEFLERFKEEAKVLSALSHPNIVQCYDAGVVGGSAYIVMEYIEGWSLGDYLKQHGVLPPTTALRIIINLAEALQHALDHNIIHRDIKCDNILLFEKETSDELPFFIKLVDLGLGYRLNSDRQDITLPGRFVGSPLVMPPEQFTEDCKFDEKIDMYSMGAILYEMIVGKNPIRGSSPTQIFALKCQPDHFTKHMPPAIGQTYPSLKRLIDQLTHPDREKRPENYLKIINSCQQALSEAKQVTCNDTLVAGQTNQKANVSLNSRKKLIYSSSLLLVFSFIALTASRYLSDHQIHPTVNQAIDKQTITKEKSKLLFEKTHTNLIEVPLLSRMNKWNFSGTWVPDEEGNGIVGKCSKKEITLSKKLKSEYGILAGNLELQDIQKSEIDLSQSIKISMQQIYSYTIVTIFFKDKALHSMKLTGKNLDFKITYEPGQVKLNLNGNSYTHKASLSPIQNFSLKLHGGLVRLNTLRFTPAHVL